MSQHVRIYLDYISNNAYLAWEELPKLAAKHGATYEPVPVLFAGLLEAHGQLGPAEVPAKRRWMGFNTLRKARLLGLPLDRPAHHPFNPLLALRASSIAEPAEKRDALVTALMRAVWTRRLHVSEPAVVAALADEVGLDGAALVARASEPDAKARLRKQTDDAIAAGVFGVPTMIVGAPTLGVGEQLFWGYDDFPYLELHLAGKDPLRPEDLARFMTGEVRPSAQRRRFRAKQG
jgi:2-hydroxychromene-2-carboxylate isomerase